MVLHFSLLLLSLYLSYLQHIFFFQESHLQRNCLEVHHMSTAAFNPKSKKNLTVVMLTNNFHYQHWNRVGDFACSRVSYTGDGNSL